MKQQQTYRIGAILALVAMSVLLVWAAVFYKERMLLCDASYIFFRIVNEQTLQIQQYRYGAFITQMVPLIAAKLHLPLKYALVAYSISFNLFYLSIALIVFRLREYLLVILMTFYYLLLTTDSFFWTNNEVLQGVAWMFLFWALLFFEAKKDKPNKAALVVIMFLSAFAVLTHPLVIFCMGFLFFFFWSVGNWPFSKKMTGILFALIIILFILRIIISKVYSPYDDSLLKNLTLNNLKTEFCGQFAKVVRDRLFPYYWLVPALFIVGLITMLIQQRFLLAAVTAFLCIGYFLAVCMTFKGFLAFYSETELMPLIIPATAPFVFLTMPHMPKWLIIGTLVYLYTHCLGEIKYSSLRFIGRYLFVNDVLYRMQQKNISRLVLVKKESGADGRFMLDWGLPTETIIASALMGQYPYRQFLICTEDKLEDDLPDNNATLISCFESWPYDKLNRRYFNLDTASYIILPVDSFIAPH